MKVGQGGNKKRAHPDVLHQSGPYIELEDRRLSINPPYAF